LSGRIDVAILAAVAEELGALAELLHLAEHHRFRGEILTLGRYADLTLLLATLGLGKVNAAITSAALFEHFAVHQVWHVGCAGAYPESPLSVGDVLITQNALCADEGILTAAGWHPQQAMGIPIGVKNGHKYYDEIPAHEPLLAQVKTNIPPGRYQLSQEPPPRAAYRCRAEHRTAPEEVIAESAGVGSSPFQVVYGPSLTVSMVSGDRQTAKERFEQRRAFAENMEGTAVAQACVRFNIAMVECRGISNLAGDRNKTRWAVDTAVHHCHGILIAWLELLTQEVRPK
jgi:futalosine hydrolase